MRKHFVLAALVVASSSSFGQVNRCIGPDGKVQYTDAVCPSSTRNTGTVGGTAAPSRDEEYQRYRFQQTESEDISSERQRLELQRERLRLERERVQLQHEQSQTAREAAPAAGSGVTIPKQTGTDSYACEVARRNLGVGISKDSKMRAQREYELACFGDKAADIEAKRAGRPQINVRTAPARPTTCHQVGQTMFCD